jgi:thiol-disulfide isomerase/thioredoxin
MDVVSKMTRLASNKYFYVVLVVAAIFIGVAFYIYRKNIAPNIDPEYVANKEFLDKDAEPANTAEFMLFYANWCPLSKKAMPVWKEFRETYDEKVINNHRLIFKEVDCSDSEDSAMQAKLDSYKVDGFPTIKMLKGNEVIDFDANPTMNSLEQFISSVIGSDKP